MNHQDCTIDQNDLLTGQDLQGAINIPAWLVVHHTGGTDANPLADTSNQSFKIVDDYHKERWNGSTLSSLGHYIGYHYFIDKGGVVTQGRADTDIGAHTIGVNQKSLGICLAGNFDATMPTDAQIYALKKLLGLKMAQYSISGTNIVPHRHFATKTCYGNKLSDWFASDLIDQTVIAPKTEDIKVTIPKPEIVIQERKKSIFEIVLNFIIKLFSK